MTGDMTRTVLTLKVLKTGFLAFALMGLIAIPTVSADVLLIEEVRQAEGMNVPDNGQTMSEVESRFGSPGEKKAPVGDPPITEWVYDGWSVYFEYDRVLFTVLHKGAVIGNDANSDEAGG